MRGHSHAHFLKHPDPLCSPGLRSTLAGPFAWGLCPLARARVKRRQAGAVRGGLPDLPRGATADILSRYSNPLVQAG